MRPLADLGCPSLRAVLKPGAIQETRPRGKEVQAPLVQQSDWKASPKGPQKVHHLAMFGARKDACKSLTLLALRFRWIHE